MSATPSATPEELERIFDTVVGAVTLRAGDLGLQRDFYERALGLSASGDDQQAELADATGRTLIRLDATRSAGSAPLRTPHTGLFHTAFRYPDRGSLAAAVIRMSEAEPEFQGASDHGVSEAVYFADAEGNGIELYRDRPYEEWPSGEPGTVAMFTEPLDLRSLIADASPREAVATADVGHIHLMASDVDRTNAFFRDVVGLNERQRFGPQATFLAEGLYHHHIGANTWQSAGAPPAPDSAPGLDSFELHLRSPEAVENATERLEAAGVAIQRTDNGVAFRDPDTNLVRLSVR